MGTKRSALGGFLLMFLAALTVQAQAPLMVWQQRTDVGSPGRYARAAMAFDERQGVTLMFGGDTSISDVVPGFPTNDLWQYDGATWTQVMVSGTRPAPRSSHALIYDPVDQRVLLFGGDAGGGVYLNDLWAFVFSGPAAGSWQRLTDLPSAGRWGMAMGYDAGRDRFVVVGGIKQGTAPQRTPSDVYEVIPATRETFLWNRSAWTAGPASADYNNGPFADGPAHRIMAGPLNGTLAYHPISGELILLAERLFPFHELPVANYGQVGGVSLFWGTNWSINTGGYISILGGVPPGSRAISSARILSAYDPVRGRLVVATGIATNTIEYTARGWTDYNYRTGNGVFYDVGQGTFGNLPVRTGFALAHDTRRGRTVFFGGTGGVTEPGDTWELVENPAAPFTITTNLAATQVELCEGEPLTLVGGVSATSRTSVRWFRDGTVIAGQTNFTFTRTSVTSADSGEYIFVVTDEAGRARTSQISRLYVHAPPVITRPPVPRRVVPGESFAMEVGWSSSLPVDVQWFIGSVPIPGATNAVFTVMSATLADAGLYTARLTTRCTVVSTVAARVMVGPVVLQHPVASTNESVGFSPVGLTVSGDGVGALDGAYTATGSTNEHPNHLSPDAPANPRPLTFTWRREGVPLVLGGRYSVSNTPLTSLLLINQPDYEDEGLYDCVVTDITGPAYAVTSKSTVLILRPLAPPYLTLQQGRGPDPRVTSGMVYDSRRKRTVLFGGTAYGMNPRSANPSLGIYGSNDTWEWDGQVWVKRNPANRPPPLVDFGIAYDSRRGRTVIFGGYSYRPPNYSAGEAMLTNSVWEWDGTDWTRPVSTTPSPIARNQPSLCYDSVRGEVLMMGGYYFNPNPTDQAEERNALWAWNGTNWTQRPGLPIPGFNQPPQVYPGNAFAFDESRGVAVMFSPFFDSRQPVCEWDGTSWTNRFPVGLKVIESRYGGSAFYDPIRRRIGLPIVGNNLVPYVTPLSAAVVFWDGTGFERGDHITLNDLTGTNLTNYFEACPNLSEGDLTAFDTERRVLVWLDTPQFYYTGPATTREMHFSAKAKTVFQPAQVFFSPNRTVQLRVISAGQRPLFQQWLKDGAPILDDGRRVGAATATLSITNATSADAGLYSLRVGNAYNQVVSRPIQLGIQPDGVAFVPVGSGLVLSWPGTTGILETAPNPAGPWTPVYGVAPPYAVALDEVNRYFRVRFP